MILKAERNPSWSWNTTFTPAIRLILENNLMEFLGMSDDDTTGLFKAISQKKAIQFERYCRGGHWYNLSQRFQNGTNLSDSKPQQTGHIHIKCDRGCW